MQPRGNHRETWLLLLLLAAQALLLLVRTLARVMRCQAALRVRRCCGALRRDHTEAAGELQRRRNRLAWTMMAAAEAN